MKIEIKAKIDRYGNLIFNNGCRSKKDLRAWVWEQNRIKKLERERENATV